MGVLIDIHTMLVGFDDLINVALAEDILILSGFKVVGRINEENVIRVAVTLPLEDKNTYRNARAKEEVGRKSQCSQTDKSPISRKPPKASSESYDSAFFKRNEIKTRQCVYISREIHRRISRIVSVLAKHELTVGGYIDLILERHLEENQEEINGLLRKEIDDWNM